MAEPDATPPRGFISYCHDSDAHAARVLALTDRVWDGGLDVIIDQCDPNPNIGQPLWMQTDLDAARFVLMVCTETYHRRVMQQTAAGVGLGVQWEGNLIYNHIYSNPAQGSRYIPLLLDGADTATIPGHVQGHTRYRLQQFELTDPHYEALYRHLTD